MKTFEVVRGFSGYVRGYKTYEVQAETEEEAIKLANQGEGILIDTDIVRDDTTEDYA